MKRKLLLFTLALGLVVGVDLFFLNAAPQAVSAPAQVVAKTALKQRLDAIARTHQDKGQITAQARQPGAHPYAAVLPSMPAVNDFRTYNPESITVEVEPGLPITYQRVSSYLSHERLVWVGRNPAIPLSIYSAAASEHTYYAVVDLAPGSYGVEIRNGVATSFYNDSPVTCGAEGSEAREAATAPSPTAPTVAAVAGTLIDIDLSIFADEASVNLKGYDDMLTQTLAEIETCNQELVNSQISNFHWVLADFVKVPATLYTFSDNMNTDLLLMSKASNPLGDLVKTTMTNSGSDEAILLVTGGGSWGGLAWVQGAYGMVRYDQLFYRTMAHEMGHNFGAMHDRITQVATATDIKSYNYGYMLNDPTSFTQSNGTIISQDYYIGDIMSYASVKAPLFANPNVTFSFMSNATQAYKTVPMGVDLNHDYPAFCAATLSDYAATFAAMGTAKPHISSQPVDTKVSPGAGATLTTIGSTGATYQWKRNGVAITGATSSTLTLPEVSTLNAGAYTCVVTINGTVITSSTATVAVNSLTDFNPNARLSNISTRSQVRSGGAAQIAGFVIAGNAPANVLIRASGPALVPFKIAGYLADPALTLYDDKALALASNDDWDSETVLSTAAALGAFGWTPASKDAATVQSLTCAAYTAIINSKDGVPGVALTEVYDASSDSSAPRLANISTRSWVDTAENAQIAGFVLRGAGMKTVLIRASGPALIDFKVSETVADPVLTLMDSAGNPIVSNDNWSDSADATELASFAATIGAFALTSGSKDAALLATLPAGNYTAFVTPKTGTAAGVGLVEIYEVK